MCVYYGDGEIKHVISLYCWSARRQKRSMHILRFATRAKANFSVKAKLKHIYCEKKRVVIRLKLKCTVGCWAKYSC